MAMYQANNDHIPMGQMLAKRAHNCPGVLYSVEIGERGEGYSVPDQGIKSNVLLDATLFMHHWHYTRDT